MKKAKTKKTVVAAPIRTTTLRDAENHYCAGCGHGIVHRLVCEAIDEFGIRDRVIGCLLYTSPSPRD